MTELHQKWTFSYLDNAEAKDPSVKYENLIHVIDNFSTVEDFWRTFSHIKQPTEIGVTNELHLFRDGYRAIWEDEVNRDGGKWYICLKKEFADVAWEKAVLSLIGEQFPLDVVGIVISAREAFILSFWVKSSEEQNLKKIANGISNVMKIPEENVLNFKFHDKTKKPLKTFIVGPHKKGHKEAK